MTEHRDTDDGSAMSKVSGLDAAVALVPDRATIGFGGAVTSRKPVAFVSALAQSGREALHVVSFAGSFDVDLLVGAGVAAQVSSAYVGFGHFGRAPHFVAACERGVIEDRESTEWLLLDGIRAAAMGKPFLPTRAGLGSDTVALQGFQSITDPYSGDEMIAVPALKLDVAVLHCWRASADGHVQVAFPPDHLWDVDPMLARAASTVVVTVDELVDRSVVDAAPDRTILFPMDVDAIVPLDFGAWPTDSRPEYFEDAAAISSYVATGVLADRGQGG